METASNHAACSVFGMGDVLARQSALLPKLHKAMLLPGCGHWTQQERPDAVNVAILDFLMSL